MSARAFLHIWPWQSITPTFAVGHTGHLTSTAILPPQHGSLIISNILVPLGSGDGGYYVWVGLRGLPPDATPTWQGTKLTLDTTPPLVAITSPASNTVSQPMIQLQGYANEALSSLTFDVSNATGIWTNQTGYVTDQFYDTNLLKFTTNYFQCYDVSLTTNGLNAITLHATDMAGNQTTTNLSFALDYSGDTTPPALTVIWPQDGTSISGSQFTFEGQVDDPTAQIIASIVDASGNTNVIQGLVERNGLVWVRNLPLNAGTNVVTVTATDAAGNTGITNFNVIENDVGLTINPLAGGQLNQSSVTVTGTVGDPIDDCVWVNGIQAYYVDDEGDWEADEVPVNPAGIASLAAQVYIGDPVLIASQTLFQLQPVTVGLKSYASHRWASGVNYSYWAEYNPATYPEAGPPAFFTTETIFIGQFRPVGMFRATNLTPVHLMGIILTCGPLRMTRGDILLSAGENAFGATWENIFTFSMSSAFSQVNIAENDTQARVMIEPSGQAVAGTLVTYLVQAQGNGGQPPAATQIQGRTLTRL